MKTKAITQTTSQTITHNPSVKALPFSPTIVRSIDSSAGVIQR